MEMAQNYVAHCPVVMFEAARGSPHWNPRALVGKLQLTLLENASISFQLRGIMDGHRLFDFILSDPFAFSELSPKFFVLRHENGSYKGFGFSNQIAAQQVKEVVQKVADKLGSTIGHSLPVETKSCRIASQVRWTKRETRSKRLKILLKLLINKNDMEIGYPTDVKHIGHIGWDSYSREELNPRFQMFTPRFDTSTTDIQGPPQPPLQFLVTSRPCHFETRVQSTRRSAA